MNRDHCRALLTRNLCYTRKGSRMHSVSAALEEKRTHCLSVHSELEAFLKLYPTPEFPEEQEVDLSTRAFCLKGCGEHFATNTSRSYKVHPKDCWLQRKNVE